MERQSSWITMLTSLMSSMLADTGMIDESSFSKSIWVVNDKMVKLPANNVFDLEQKRLNQLIAENNNWIYSLSFGVQNLCAVPVPLKKRKTQRIFDHKNGGYEGEVRGHYWHTPHHIYHIPRMVAGVSISDDWSTTTELKCRFGP